jgi:uncharacterized protein (TIGR00369 family)
MDWAPERCTAGGVMHGGALMLLADTAGAVVAFLNLPEGAVGTATTESKTNLLRAVTAGAVKVESRPIHRGGTLAVIESATSDDEGPARREGDPDPGLLLPAWLTVWPAGAPAWRLQAGDQARLAQPLPCH